MSREFLNLGIFSLDSMCTGSRGQRVKLKCKMRNLATKLDQIRDFKSKFISQMGKIKAILGSISVVLPINWWHAKFLPQAAQFWAILPYGLVFGEILGLE